MIHWGGGVTSHDIMQTGEGGSHLMIDWGEGRGVTSHDLNKPVHYCTLYQGTAVYSRRRKVLLATGEGQPQNTVENTACNLLPVQDAVIGFVCLPEPNRCAHLGQVYILSGEWQTSHMI